MSRRQLVMVLVVLALGVLALWVAVQVYVPGSGP